MDALFSKTVKAGDRVYFIDVKQAKNNTKYLTIAESKPNKDGEKKFSRSCVMVFEGYAPTIRGALDEAWGLLDKHD